MIWCFASLQHYLISDNERLCTVKHHSHESDPTMQSDQFWLFAYEIRVLSFMEHHMIPKLPKIYIFKRYLIKSFPTSGNFCRLLIIFANSSDPDQARQNVGPDLDPNCLTV